MDKRHAYCMGDLRTRAEDNGEKVIEGYFAVFGQEVELCHGYYEQIAPGAFTKSLRESDVRCLFNHDTGAVLGRAGNGTLELREDAHGLWGRVKINSDDSQAMGVYARVARGDINGCSFGFDPVGQNVEDREDGLHWTVTEADTAEVSICTFPAYPQTEIQARQQDAQRASEEQWGRRKAALKQKLEEIKC